MRFSFRAILVAAGLALLPACESTLGARVFRLPTENDALLTPGGAARFFAPTPGRTWEAGQFGCVRSEGWKMHEGIDILAVQRDRRGEPLDEVRAIADGEVAYISRKPGLSNYGIYVVVRHRIEGLEFFSLYAHLRQVRAGLSPGERLRSGETLGGLGRTTNTRSPITRDRAHLHLEIDLIVNDRFSSWLKAREPGTRDDHGMWNGRNLLGLDAAEVYRAQQRLGSKFSLLGHIRGQKEMCRVLVADTSFPWLRRYPMLIRRNALAEREGIAAYEVSLNFNGLPFALVPRARSEIQGTVATRLLSVDAAEYQAHPCRKLVFRRGQAWVLTAAGNELLHLLTY